jgi:hypothetical protein
LKTLFCITALLVYRSTLKHDVHFAVTEDFMDADVRTWRSDASYVRDCKAVRQLWERVHRKGVVCVKGTKPLSQDEAERMVDLRSSILQFGVAVFVFANKMNERAKLELKPKGRAGIGYKYIDLERLLRCVRQDLHYALGVEPPACLRSIAACVKSFGQRSAFVPELVFEKREMLSMKAVLFPLITSGPVPTHLLLNNPEDIDK